MSRKVLNRPDQVHPTELLKKNEMTRTKVDSLRLQLEKAESLFLYQGDLTHSLRIVTRHICASTVPEQFEIFLKGLDLQIRILAEMDRIAEIENLKIQYLDFLLLNRQMPSYQLYYVLGICSSYSKKFEQALDYFNTSSELATSNNESEGVFKSAIGKALIFNRTQQSAKAIQILKSFDTESLTAMNIPVNLKTFLPLVRSRIYREQGQFQKAKSDLAEFYKIMPRMNSFYLHIRGLYEKAMLAKNLQKIDQAQILLESLLEMTANSDFVLFHKAVQAALLEISKPQAQFDLELDFEKREMKEKSKGSIQFSHQFLLFELFKILFFNKGQPLSKGQIVERLWKEEYDPRRHDNKLYVTIRRLREMIEPDDQPKYIFRNSEGYYFGKDPKVFIQPAHTKDMETHHDFTK